MAVMKMAALTLIGPKEEMGAAARRLMLSCSFQPLPLDAIVNDRAIREQITTDTKNPYTELLTSISALWQMADKPLPKPQDLPVAKDFTLTKAQMLTEEISGKLNKWSKEKAALVEETESLNASHAFLQQLQGTRFTWKDLDCQHLKFYFWFMTSDNIKRLADFEASVPAVTDVLFETRDTSCVVVIVPAEFEEQAEKFARTLNLKDLHIGKIISEAEGDPAEYVAAKITENNRTIEALTLAAKTELNQHEADYEKLYSQIYSMQRIYDTCVMRGEFSDMFIVSGWVPCSAIDEVKNYQDAPNTSFIISEPEELSDVQIPIKLKNNAIVRAFQEIVAMYSMPAYGEMDPSPVVALTFVIFFGLMFGDIGHGLLIILGVTAFMKRGIMGRGLARVMQFAGVSSMIFGALYGSIFGFEDVIPALWLSPMHDSNTLIAYAICVGVAVVTLGMLINMIAQCKARNYGRMLFDGGGLAGLVFYLTLCATPVAAMLGHGDKVSYMLYGAGVLLLVMLFKENLAHAIFKETGGEGIVMSFFEIIHNLLSFLSNTASFVRLAAFALNHVGLSIAVMMLADMVKNAPGGVVFKTIVLIIGNLLIVGLEGLIVFIQTLRLEYYEFFSKFYKGGGREFKPVAWTSKKTAAAK